jgi:hypothetical protein
MFESTESTIIQCHSMFESTILQFKETSTSEHGFGTFWNVSEPFFSSRKMTPKCPVVSRCVPVTCPGRSSTGGGFEAPCYRFTGIFGWTFGKVNPWLSIGYPCCYMLLPNEKTSCFAMDTSQKVAIVQ